MTRLFQYVIGNYLSGGYASWWLQHNAPIWGWIRNTYKQVQDVLVFSSAGRKIFPPYIVNGLKNMKDLIEGRQWQEEDIKLEEIYTILRVFGTICGERYGAMTDEDWKVYWYSKH
jgi:hypothetical protein